MTLNPGTSVRKGREDGDVRHSAIKMADKNNGGQATPEAGKSARKTAGKSVRK